MKTAKEALDHLLLGIADLDQGIEWVQQKTGVRAIPGGSHPGAGTRNALLSLGSRQYLEIIAIDPLQKTWSAMAALIANQKEPRLIAWAACTDDMESTMQLAKSASFAIEGPSDGARERADGVMLRWKVLRIQNDFGCVIPFFIEWEPGIVHPSEDSPSGCRLEEFQIAHSEADRVLEALEKLGIKADLTSGRYPRLSAALSTPIGRIRLS